MKKALLYSIFALGIASTTLTSCEDIFGGFLDKQPSNELTGEQVFSDWNLTVQFHLDTYNFLRHGAGRISTTWLDAANRFGRDFLWEWGKNLFQYRQLLWRFGCIRTG